VTLGINKELCECVKNYNINISSFLEIRLREYIALVEGIAHIEKKQCGRRDLNPSFKLGKLK
jgi:hypothetical protein